MTGPFLVTTGLSKEYRSGRDVVVVLDDVDLTVGRGEVVRIDGPSGSGSPR